MKPAAFDYFAPGSVEEALELLSRHGMSARLLAGGQSFVPMAAFRLLRPDVVIDLNRIHALAFIRDIGSGLSIGAMTRHRAIEQSDLVRRRCPLMTEAVGWIGHAAIRNRGTLGGSLAHADPAAVWPVVALALGATFVVRSAQRERRIPAAEFFVSLLSTALAPDEILVEIEMPAAPAGSGAAFVEISRRHGDFALVSVGAQVTTSADGQLSDIRMALGGCSASPFDASGIARSLLGTAADSKAVADLGARVSDAITPTDDLHASAQYRREVAAVLVKRALDEALHKARSLE